MPKQNAIATIEGVIKGYQQRKGSRDEAEEYINIMGTNNRQAMVTDRREYRKIVLEAKVQKRR
jgi:ABC-type sulfate transport system substrate-binding protein